MSDTCAKCAQPLKPGPMGTRLQCCSKAYWSKHAPLPKDRKGFAQLGGGQIESKPDLWAGGQWYLYRPAGW